MQMSGMLILYGLCIIGGIGCVIFGLHQRSRETCRHDASGGSPAGAALPSSAEELGPLGILGERSGPDEEMTGPIGIQTDEELTGQSKTGVGPIGKTGNLWSSLAAPMRVFRRRKKREEKVLLDIPTATGTALIPRTVKSLSEESEDGQPGSG